MGRFRVIPVLLLHGGGLVKGTKFKDHQYIGDPINAVKVFNDKEVDEIALLDIDATRERRGPNLDQIEQIASEAFMPLAYGGGITTVEQCRQLFQRGIEKVILNSSAIARPALIEEAAKVFGSQSIVVSIDVKKTLMGGFKVFSDCGAKNTGFAPVEFARRMESAGAGELLLTSIDRDGTGTGFEIELVRSVADSVQIPVVACGGAATISDLARGIHDGGASAVAAGSMFVYHGRRRAVLINFPIPEALRAASSATFGDSNK